MKRLVIVLPIMLMLGVLALSCPSLAHPNSIPHENPAAAAGSLDTAELLLFYSDMFNTGADRRYQDSRDMLEEFRALDFAGELKYVTDRYNRISEELFITLNQTEFHLNEASNFFAENQFHIAEESLTASKTALQNARSLLNELETSAALLIERLPVQLDSATSQFNQACQQLQKSLQRLHQLTDELEHISNHLKERPDATITTRFYHPTLLEIATPATIYPGLPFTVTGWVQSDYENVERTFSVLFDDSELASTTALGHFTLESTVSPHASTGKHELTVQVAAQDNHAAASQSQHITVTRLPVQCEIHSPRLAVMPQEFTVTGTVQYNLESIPDAGINLSVNDFSATTVTDSNGNFAVTVRPSISIATTTAANPFYTTTTTQTLPFDFSLFGWREMTVTIDPAEPWYTPVKLTGQTFVINPVNTALLLALLFSLSLSAYRRSRAMITEPDINLPLPEDLPSFTPLSSQKTDFSGIKREVLSSYKSGLTAVEKASGISMTAPGTLREFLNAVSPLLTTTAALFAELTELAELALYSPHQPGEDTALRAEQLAVSLKKETHLGTP